jgi:hypothetical protein
MKAWMLSRWLCGEALRNPWTWALGLALVGLWPAIQVLTPFGAETSSVAARELVYEVAFVAGGVGVAWALRGLEILPSCSYALGIRPGWVSEGCVLAASGIATSMLALAVPLAASWPLGARLGVEAAARIALSSAALAAIALVVLRIPSLAGAQGLALIVVIWIVPAILRASFVSDFLGRGPSWRADVAVSGSALASRITSISALLLAVHLLDAHRRERS